MTGIRAHLVQGLSPDQQALLREGLLAMIANLDAMSADSGDPAAAAS